MAAPGVAGAALLVRQYFVDGFSPSGTKKPEDGFDPSGALVKAVILNSGRVMLGRDNGSSVFPSTEFDESQGFGLISLVDGLYLKDKSKGKVLVWDREPLTSGQEWKESFKLGKCEAAHTSVTLTYFDKENSSTSCNPCLVNRIDLTIEKDGETYYPNGLSGADKKNNSQRIRVPHVEGDLITVKVRATNLVTSEQKFALVVSGCLEDGTNAPTMTKTQSPTGSPTQSPTDSPTGTPTGSPTGSPTQTQSPTGPLTQSPTGSPSKNPTGAPQTQNPTRNPTAVPITGDKNISLNKSVTVSSNESDELVGSKAVDGDSLTRWSSAYMNNQWIYVDLGSNYDISKVVLKWEAWASFYSILTWDSIFGRWNTKYLEYNGQGGVETIEFPFSARYVALVGYNGAQRSGISLYEFEIYERDEVCEDDPDFFFHAPFKTCAWIDRQRPKKQNRLCNRYFKGEAVSSKCPKVCGKCPEATKLIQNFKTEENFVDTSPGNNLLPDPTVV